MLLFFQKKSSKKIDPLPNSAILAKNYSNLHSNFRLVNAMPQVLQDEDSVEVVTYSDLFILTCIFINTAFIAVSAHPDQKFICVFLHSEF